MNKNSDKKNNLKQGTAVGVKPPLLSPTTAHGVDDKINLACPDGCGIRHTACSLNDIIADNELMCPACASSIFPSQNPGYFRLCETYDPEDSTHLKKLAAGAALLYTSATAVELELFTGADWAALLAAQPSLAPYCGLSPDSNADYWTSLADYWPALLAAQPQFRTIYDTICGNNIVATLNADIRMAKFCPWATMSQEDILNLLLNFPELAHGSVLESIDGKSWVALLLLHQHLGQVCRWDTLSGEDWQGLLTTNPEYATKCDWTKLRADDWVALLLHHPAFGSQCNWALLTDDQLAELRPAAAELYRLCKPMLVTLPPDDFYRVINQMQLGKQIDWSEIDTGEGWLHILKGNPGLAPYCDSHNGWDLFCTHDWAELIASQPRFATKCPWDTLSPKECQIALAAHPELLSYWPNSLKKIGRYYAFRDCPAIASHLAAPFLAMVLGVGIVFWGITAMGGPLGWLTLFSEIPSQAIVAAFVYLIWSGLCCSLLIKYWVTPYPRPIMVLCGLGAATTIHAIYIGSVFLSNLSLSVIMAMLLMLGLLLLPRITGMRPLWLFLILPFLAWHSLLSIGAVDYFALSTMTTKAHHANPQTAATLTSNAPAEPLNAVREDLAPMEADHANSIPDATVQQHPLLTETKEIQQTPGAMTDETRAVKLIARIDSALTAGKWEEAGPLVDELTAIPDATLSASTKLRLIAISDKYRNPPNPNSPAVAIPAGDKSTPAAVGSDNSPKALPMPTEDMETRAVTQDKISTPPALAPMPEPAALPAPMPAPPVAAKDAQPSPNAQVGPAKATAAQQQTQLLPGEQQATLTPPGATGNTAPSPKTSAVMAAVISVEQARLLHNSGKTAEALQMLSVITSSEAKALAAEIAIEQTVAKKDYATAEAQAKAYIATWPKSSIGYRWLAEILSDGYNDITSSLDMASTALALAPDNTSAFITRGNTKLKLSPPDLDGAETDYRKALSLARQKEGIAAHNGLGLVYLQRSRISAQKDNLDLARSSFRMALASDPQNPHSLQGMALIDAEEGLFSSAFAQINQAIAIAPENAEQYRTRATIATAAHARDELKTHPLCSAVAIFHDYASYIDRLSKTAHGGTPVDLWPIIATWGAAGIEAEDENADFLATATRVANVFSRHFQTLPDAFFTDKNGAGLLWKKVAMRLPGSELKRLLLSKDFAKDFTFRSDLLRRNSRGSVSSALYREIQTDNAVAMYYLGQHFKYAPPPDEKMCLAFEWFSKAAQKGLVEAQYEVALCYESGHGVANNQQLATSWYMTAAEAGYAEAQFRVADRYCTGTFVPQSYATGAAWLEKAAKQGHVPAIAALADLYYTGDGVGKDMERSFALATIAATNHDLRGQFRLATLNYTGEGIQKDMEKAIPLMQQCAQEGYPLAQYQLGLMYHNGEVTGKKDISKAILWYKKAAAQGHAKAITALKSLSHAHAEVGSPRPK